MRTPEQEKAIDELGDAIERLIDTCGGLDGGFITGWVVSVVSVKPDDDDANDTWDVADYGHHFVKPGTSVTLIRGLLETTLDKYRDRS